jgi:hypothetical protein
LKLEGLCKSPTNGKDHAGYVIRSVGDTESTGRLSSGKSVENGRLTAPEDHRLRASTDALGRSGTKKWVPGKRKKRQGRAGAAVAGRQRGREGAKRPSGRPPFGPPARGGRSAWVQPPHTGARPRSRAGKATAPRARVLRPEGGGLRCGRGDPRESVRWSLKTLWRDLWCNSIGLVLVGVGWRSIASGGATSITTAAGRNSSR